MIPRDPAAAFAPPVHGTGARDGRDRPAAADALPAVAVVCPLSEEGWHSMDWVAEMLLRNLGEHHAHELRAARVRPPLVRRLERVPGVGAWRGAVLGDRLINRFGDYPRHLRRVAGGFDLVHLVDHSYGQVVRGVAADRLVVTCHDLDAFRAVLEPERERRPGWYRWMVRRQLDGVRRAARVVCVTRAVADELAALGVAPPERVRVVPNGIDPACTPAADREADGEAGRLLGPVSSAAVELLHVGSTVPRKRVDLLLRVFAAVRRARPNARLVRVGGAFSPEQAALAERLGVAGAVSVLPFLDRAVLAAVYRRATLVLQPSDAEGFGLPVAEAMACGTPVLATGLPALREVGGDAAEYAPAGDPAAWTRAVLDLLAERDEEPARWSARRRRCAARGGSFSWRAHARGMVEVYREVLRAGEGAP